MKSIIIIDDEESKKTAVMATGVQPEELIMILLRVLTDLSKEVAIRHHCDTSGCQVIEVSHDIIRLVQKLEKHHEEEKEKTQQEVKKEGESRQQDNKNNISNQS